MLLSPQAPWKSWMVINLMTALLAVQPAAAQPHTLCLKPYLGFQQPFAKKIFSEVINADFKNNRFGLLFTYGFRLEYNRTNDVFFFELLNGQAGYNAGVNHKNYCRELNRGRVDSYNAGSANNNRFVFGYGRNIGRGRVYSKFWVQKMIGTGITFDIRASEDLNAGRFDVGGYSSCGEFYTFPDTTYNIKNFGIGIPILFDVKTFFRRKPFVAIQFFANLGLINRYTTDLLYKTVTATRVSRVITKGTVIGFSLSCPIKIKDFKKSG